MLVSKVWGTLVKQIRQEKGVSQHKLAAHSGVTRGALRRLESGDCVVNVATLETVLEYLGYELEAISKTGPDVTPKKII